MIVRLRFFGPLTRYTGSAPVVVDLPEHTRLRDILEYIAEHWGDQFPTQFWDSQKRQFQPAVMMLVNQRRIDQDQTDELNTPLEDGHEVRFVYAAVGG